MPSDQAPMIHFVFTEIDTGPTRTEKKMCDAKIKGVFHIVCHIKMFFLFNKDDC